MDKKAFTSVWAFMRRNIKIVLLLIVLMLGITFGERQLSTVLQQADLKILDYALAMVRMVLQTMLSTALVFLWHKQKETAAPFSAVDILKLFVTNLVVTVLLSLCVVLVVTIPLAVWLYLRFDFYMNEYITGRSNGIFSCVGSSFRRTKGFAGRYLVYNIKFLLFYFVVEFALTGFMIARGQMLPAGWQTGLDIFDAVFLSVLMPYRFLLKCGFYTVHFEREEP